MSREIALFRSLHPDRPVLAALIAGTPTDSFPDTLADAAREPLAADLQPTGDGPRLGFLKLVAGVVGVGLDELVQRDAQRRLRAVTAVTAAALGGMLTMTLLTAMAIEARREAERQRAEAEGMVEFMLTDLRDTLEGVGRLDALDAVNTRALEYYEAQDIGRLPPDSLERRARVLLAIGTDLQTRGDLDQAMQHFEEARRTTAALLAADSDNPARMWAHAQSEQAVGVVASTRETGRGADRIRSLPRSGRYSGGPRAQERPVPSGGRFRPGQSVQPGPGRTASTGRRAGGLPDCAGPDGGGRRSGG
ncbi:hypothetical protein [Brevundimonas denitrificans]|uniref:hypothetical protein n=1 Tax=Brevundimonas denitrificans TaxID=1443434 RepID=UPI00223ACAAA|nr:hypothetical protein [Brevundimonas denitrificans]